MRTAPCPCASPSHDGRCPQRALLLRRGELFDGLYDHRPAPAPPRARVRLLNAGLTADDATARRFALLEID
jgi:hypothetical protein